MQNKNNKQNSGYTIIETMIAVSLFIIIALAGTTSLLNANLVHQKSQGVREIMDNLSFLMEDIGRNVRTGYNYRCVTSNNDLSDLVVGTAQSGANCYGLAFEYQYGDSTDEDGDPVDNADQWVYFVGTAGSDPNTRLYKSTSGPYTVSSNFTSLVPDEVTIDASASGFSVLGAEPPTSDLQQPFVIIRLLGTINYQNVSTPFSLQTSISGRLIDI